MKILIRTALMLVLFGFVGVAAAADSIDIESERLKQSAKSLGQAYAREGNRIADEAVDAANTVADNFVDAYEKSKDDLRDQ